MLLNKYHINIHYILVLHVSHLYALYCGSCRSVLTRTRILYCGVLYHTEYHIVLYYIVYYIELYCIILQDKNLNIFDVVNFDMVEREREREREGERERELEIERQRQRQKQKQRQIQR